ncbi:MAG: PH domain-containing protein [Cyclobacteriaceae bacterium]|nr:PH domain-containing protein [Cyclobacteriaceae bacterium]
MKYQSKIDNKLLLFIFGVLVTNLVWMIYLQSVIGIIIIALTSAFIIHVFVTTYYVITSDHFLIVKSSFLINKKISIQDITSIKESNNILSSPALSFDRIEIKYKDGSILVSPREKEKFIQELKARNATILY